MKIDSKVILSIETSSSSGSVALVEEKTKTCIAEFSLNTTLPLSQNLFMMVRHILEYTHLSYSCLVGVGVSGGPGSFTGLKVGMATAKSIAFSMNIPIFSISTFDIMIENLQVQLPFKIQPFIDARKGEVYTTTFQWDEREERYIRITPEINVKIPLFISSINSPTLITGNFSMLGKNKDIENLLFLLKQKQQKQQKQKNISLGTFTPKASHLGILTAQKIKRGEQPNNLSLSPRYIRKQT